MTNINNIGFDLFLMDLCLWPQESIWHFSTRSTFMTYNVRESSPAPSTDLQEVLLQTETSVGHVKVSLLILRSYKFPQNNLPSASPAKNSTESILRPRSCAELIIKYAWFLNVKHDTQPRQSLRNMSYLQYGLIRKCLCLRIGARICRLAGWGEREKKKSHIYFDWQDLFGNQYINAKLNNMCSSWKGLL